MHKTSADGALKSSGSQVNIQKVRLLKQRANLWCVSHLKRMSLKLRPNQSIIFINPKVQ